MTAKIRPLHPEFFTDDAVCGLPPLARLMFQGLWCLACDNGHVEDRSRQIKRRVLPDDEVNANELIEQIASSDLIERIDGWIIIAATHRWKVDWRYFKTCEYPGCAKPERKTQRAPGGDTAGTQREPAVDPAGTRRAPATDGDGDGDGDGDISRSPAERIKVASADKSAETPDRFDEFWDAYGKKVGRKKAEQKFKLATKKADPDLLIAAAESYVRSQVAKGKHPEFTKDPATWLNGEHWNDEATATVHPIRPAADPDAWMRPGWGLS